MLKLVAVTVIFLSSLLMGGTNKPKTNSNTPTSKMDTHEGPLTHEDVTADFPTVKCVEFVASLWNKLNGKEENDKEIFKSPAKEWVPKAIQEIARLITDQVEDLAAGNGRKGGLTLSFHSRLSQVRKLGDPAEVVPALTHCGRQFPPNPSNDEEGRTPSGFFRDSLANWVDQYRLISMMDANEKKSRESHEVREKNLRSNLFKITDVGEVIIDRVQIDKHLLAISKTFSEKFSYLEEQGRTLCKSDHKLLPPKDLATGPILIQFTFGSCRRGEKQSDRTFSVKVPLARPHTTNQDGSYELVPSGG